MNTSTPSATAPERITLHNGELEFSALAIGEGPLVLCLHGFPDNAETFHHQLPAFASAGYRAVAVTMRGYEPSSQPASHSALPFSPSDYAQEAIAGDIVAFVEQLGDGKAHLVGHDWGASIAYHAVAAAPERFASLTTIAVPHSGRFLNEAIRYPKQLRLSWYMGFFQLRGIAEYYVKRNNYAFIRKLWRDWSPGWNVPEHVMASAIHTLQQPGVLKAALAYYRQALAPKAFLPKARAAARFQVAVPTLGLTGEREGCIDSKVFQAMMIEADFPSGLEVHQLAGAGHFLHQEKPEAVNELILSWLKRWPATVDRES